MKPKKISLTKKEFVREHKHLISVLRGASRKEQMREADKQARELKENT